jgi:hypothetical protein
MLKPIPKKEKKDWALAVCGRVTRRWGNYRLMQDVTSQTQERSENVQVSHIKLLSKNGLAC